MPTVHETNDGQLIEEVRGLRGEMRELLTKLLGDATAENPHGRIPRLETQVADHEDRLGILEGIKQRAGGAGWLIALAVGGVDLIYHLSSIAQALMKH